MTRIMTKYSYSGRAAGGQRVSGAMEGASAGAVADQLSAQNIIALEIQPLAVPSAGKGAAANDAGASGQAVVTAPARRWQDFGSRVSTMEVLLFSRQMHTLLKAGVPVMRALAALQESTVKPVTRQLLQSLRSSLDAGRDLSQALAMHGSVFSAFYIAMVRVGEMSGRMEEVFLRLFHHLEFEQFMRDQVKSALRYPGFVVIAMGIAMVIIGMFVIPAFARIFSGFGVQLPLATRLLIGFSELMQAWWWAMLLIAGALVWAFSIWTKTTRGRLRWDHFKLNIPLAGPIVQKAMLARFSRGFSLAMKSGVPVTQAMGVVALTVENTWISSKISRMREGVERGESVMHTAAAAGVFTPLVLQMLAVGEESGEIDSMMDEVAAMYQREVEYELKLLGQQIEPILILLLGALVLVLALGVFLPMWDLSRVAQGKGL
jgi:MSHA biogenesis protein MshG